MNVCDEQLLLSAYLDGELDAQRAQRVEQHVRGCAACAAELEMLRDASRQLREYPFEDITATELADLHRGVEESGDEQKIWRIGGTIGLIAASVMIVGMAWLKALPAPSARPGSGNIAVQTKPQPWEKTAITLRADPVYSTDADWMLEQLAMGR